MKERISSILYFERMGGKRMGSTSDQSYYWQKKHLAEQLWLHYFNSILFQKGLITETQHNRINTMIRSRKMEITQIKKRNYLLEKKN